MFIHLTHFIIICKEDYFMMMTLLNWIKNSGEGYLVIFVAWTMSIFCWYSDMIMEWWCFVFIHPSHGVALSDVNVLWNCSCSTREHHQLADNTRPAVGCQGLLFSFSRFIFIIFNVTSSAWYGTKRVLLLAPWLICVAMDKSESFPETQLSYLWDENVYLTRLACLPWG